MTASDNNTQTKTPVKRYINRGFFFIIAVTSLFFVALAFLTLFGSTERHLELLTHLRVQLLLPLLAALPILIFFRARVLLALVAAGVLIHLFDIAPLYFGSRQDKSTETVRVLTINVNNWNKNYSGVRNLIERESPDIVCLQELTPEMGTELSSKLKSYPYRVIEASNGCFGIAIFSKMELLSIERLKLCPDDILTLSAFIDVHGTKLRLINTHPIAPLNDVYYGWRNQQLAALADLSNKTKEPVIVVGDLNLTYFSPFFKRLLKDGNLTDSEFGFGVQPSWSAQWWPLNAPFDCFLFRLPLDHVLFKGPITTQDRRLLEGIGSDHSPVLVTLGISAKD